MSKQPPPAPSASAVGPCPTLIQNNRTPRHRLQLTLQMLHIKFEGHLPSGSGEEYCFHVWDIHGHGRHLGHVAWTKYIDSPLLPEGYL